MPLVAILGAGEIGGAAARALAIRSKFGAIRLIDEQPGVAAGKALDLQQAGSVDRYDTRLEGHTDAAAAVGASVVVLADTMAGGEWHGESAMALLRRLDRLGCFHQSVLVCAGAGHRQLMQFAVDELRLPRARIVGSAPEALAATARSLVAVEAASSSSQVALTVLGQPPQQIVIPWQDASIGGHCLTTVLAQPQLNRVEFRVKGLWPPGPATLGSAAALFADAVLNSSRRLLSAFVSLDRDNGTAAPVCAWPVRLGAAGLEKVATPSLTGRDRVVLDGVLGNDAV